MVLKATFNNYLRTMNPPIYNKSLSVKGNLIFSSLTNSAYNFNQYIKGTSSSSLECLLYTGLTVSWIFHPHKNNRGTVLVNLAPVSYGILNPMVN